MPASLHSIVHNKGKKKFTSKQLSQRHCYRLLSESSQYGVLFRGCVWMPCTRQIAYLLDRICFGRRVPREAVVGVPLFLDVPSVCADSFTVPSGNVLDAFHAIVIRLSAQEAVYAAWVLECLTIYTSAPGGSDTNKKQASLCRLSPPQLWHVVLQTERARSFGRHLFENTAAFVPRLASYVHFRNNGWLPKSGLQYGSDFVLYRNVPSLVHSDYCVILQPASDAFVASERVTLFEMTKKNLKEEMLHHPEFGEWLDKQIYHIFGLFIDLQAVSRLCGQETRVERFIAEANT
mmetsp:Transcript_3667/g.14764  ORF Transcript_3667/g.14764 Transcript_3667/m.14764 type:complete len:291 (+) Transcript_3667:365-1237(+)